MDYYKEYTIRCKTCNEQIACWSYLYNTLLETGFTTEEALNELNITNYCSRIAMMNPTIVTFNMENREVIEGYKIVTTVREDDPQSLTSTEMPAFSPCSVSQKILPSVSPFESYMSTHNMPITKTIPTYKTKIEPILQITSDLDIEKMGDAIELKPQVDVNPDVFNTPTQIGFPTINHRTSQYGEVKIVGYDHESSVLTGRTYLAR